MTRKDYEAFAKMFAKEIAFAEEEYNDSGKAALVYIARESANIFARDNARFDRERFLRACGIE